MARLPITKAQIATSITIRALKEDVSVESLADADAIRALAESSVVVGAIMSFSETNRRSTTPRYELDADVAGEIVERIPQLIERTLRVNRAILYGKDIVQAFGFTDAQDLLDQNKPFIIMRVDRAPAGSGVADKTVIYSGCWIHDFPFEAKLSGGDLLIEQDVEIGFARKFTA